MRAVFLIAFQMFRHMKHDKTALIWTIVVPCFYIFIFGSAMRHDSDPSQTKAYLAVLNHDSEGLLAQRLLQGISTDHIQIDTLTALPEEKDKRALVIPAHFSDSLLAGKTVQIEYFKNSDMNIEASQTVELGIRKSMYRLLADLTELKINSQKINSVALDNLDKQPATVTLETSFAGHRQAMPQGYYNQVPANIIQFSLLVLLIYASSSTLEERKNGVFRRMLSSPIKVSQLFWGKLLGVVIVGLSQIILLMLIGRFVFGIHYGHEIVSLMLLLLFYCITVSALGLSLGFLIENHEKVVGISIISGLLMAALSGCWWPIELTPPWMQKLAMALPPGIALNGMHKLISFGQNGLAVLPNMLGLFSMAVLFSLFFSKFIRQLKPDI